MSKILTDIRERILFEISVAVRRVVQHEFDRIAELIIASERRNREAIEQLALVGVQRGSVLPKLDEEAVLEARKRILVPGLTKELEAQIDWDRMG